MAASVSAVRSRAVRKNVTRNSSRLLYEAIRGLDVGGCRKSRAGAPCPECSQKFHSAPAWGVDNRGRIPSGEGRLEARWVVETGTPASATSGGGVSTRPRPEGGEGIRLR